MKVLFVSHSAGMYGAERSLGELVSALDRTKIQPFVLLPRKGPLVDLLVRNQVPFLIAPYHLWIRRKLRRPLGMVRWLQNISAVRDLISDVKRIGPDCIYTNTITTPVGALLSRDLGLRHIWHIRECVQDGLNSDFDFGTSFVADFINSTADALIFNSSALRQKYGELLHSQTVAVIYNGPLTCKPGRKASIGEKNERVNRSICIIGSLGSAKGHHIVLNALSLLPGDFDDVRLKIVGSGDRVYLWNLKLLARLLKVQNRIDWLGFRHDAMDILEESDAVIVASKFEAFGRVAVESMAMGCPVIAARSGGTPEIIADGVNGLLFRPDDAKSLAMAIERLYRDQDLRGKIVSTGLKSVYPKFSRARYVAEISTLLLSMSSGTASSRTL